MALPKRILIATHNKHKYEEISAMLAEFSIELVSAASIEGLPSPEEDGDTFLANALIKADASFKYSGIPCLADDSGLVVPILGGAPGIHSSRYAEESADQDQANRTKLVGALSSFSGEQRKAHFTCTLVLRLSEEEYVSFNGECHGEIIDEERGEHGFGYDPIFFVPSYNKTLAQLDPTIKNQISHRANAIAQLRDWIKQSG